MRWRLPLILNAFLLGNTIATGVGADSTRDLPDPTRPAVFATVVDPQIATDDAPLELSAVFFAADRSVAIINGVRVRNGDSIGNARVVRIFDNRVRIEQDGKPFELRLIPSDIKEAREVSP